MVEDGIGRYPVTSHIPTTVRLCVNSGISFSHRIPSNDGGLTGTDYQSHLVA